VHAMNRNVDMTYMVHNNQVYALTAVKRVLQQTWDSPRR